MAYSLVPRHGQGYLSPRAAVTRLLSKFPYVATSGEDGRRYVQAIIRQLQAIREAGEVSIDTDLLHRLEKAQDQSIYVYFGDWNSEAPYIGTAVIPGEPLFFCCTPGPQEPAAKNLVIRCAEALNYDVLDL